MSGLDLLWKIALRSQGILKCATCTTTNNKTLVAAGCKEADEQAFCTVGPLITPNTEHGHR